MVQLTIQFDPQTKRLQLTPSDGVDPGVVLWLLEQAKQVALKQLPPALAPPVALPSPELRRQLLNGEG